MPADACHSRKFDPTEIRAVTENQSIIDAMFAIIYLLGTFIADRAYGQAFQRRIRAMRIRDRPISPRSPWQNPYAERLIGSLRRA